MHTATNPFGLNLSRTRPLTKLLQNQNCDTLIIGDNLACAFLAFQLLESTQQTVIIICPSLMGDSCNHLSQNTLYPTQSILDLITTHGPKNAKLIYQSPQKALPLLKTMFLRTGITTPTNLINSYQVYYQDSQIENKIKELNYLHHLKLPHKKILLSSESVFSSRLSSQYYHLCDFLPQRKLQAKIHSNLPKLIGIYPQKNLSIYTQDLIEKLVIYCQKKYPARLKVYENVSPSKIKFKTNLAEVSLSGSQIICKNFINSQASIEKFQKLHGYPNRHGKKTPFLNYYDDIKSQSFLAQQSLTHQKLVYFNSPNPVRFLKMHFDTYTKFPQPLTYQWKIPLSTTKTGLPQIGRHWLKKPLFYLQFPSSSYLADQLVGAQRLAKLLQGQHLAPHPFDPPRLKRQISSQV